MKVKVLEAIICPHCGTMITAPEHDMDTLQKRYTAHLHLWHPGIEGIVTGVGDPHILFEKNQ